MNESRFEELKKKEIQIQKQISRLLTLSNIFSEKINYLSQVYVSRWQGFVEVERAMSELVEQHRACEERIEWLQQKSLRLQYDLSVYEDKMKETEEIIDNFHGKLFTLQDRINQALQSMAQLDLLTALKSLLSL